jgi:hypothetical protein
MLRIGTTNWLMFPRSSCKQKKIKQIHEQILQSIYIKPVNSHSKPAR